MKNKNIKYLVLIFAGCLFWSCKKELNVFPSTSEVDGNVIVDAKGASTVLNGVYYRFANAIADFNGVPQIEWSTVNEVTPSELAGSLTNEYGDDFVAFKFTSKSDGVDYIWNYGYLLVNSANGFLKNVAPVTKIPAAAKKQMQAEARFLRAFGNSELLLYYGQYNDVNSKYGIILRDEFVKTTNVILPRSSVAATYTSILADLDTAIANLPAQNTAICYANASAAKLLKARVLINRGASGDYAQVISLTNDVITNSPFTLEDSVKDIFLTKGFSSKEVIMGAQPFAVQDYKFHQNQYNEQFPVKAAYSTLLINGDSRNEWVYKQISSPFYGPIKELTKYYTGDPLDISQTPLTEYCYAFRLTEAYLLEAEAITLSGGDLSIAKTLLKTVEAHAGVKDFTDVDNANSPEALQLLVVKEELRSFVAENGADWLALRRLPFSTMQTLRPAIKSIAQLILPIPQSEILTNNIPQNPGLE